MTQSLRALLHGVVDYAGLFPPAKLDMAPAAENYERYMAGAHNWMLGRFVLPVARFEAFLSAVPDIALGWRISALATDGGDGARISEFNRANEGRFVVDSVELKPPSADAVAELVRSLPDGVDAFVETPWDTDAGEWFAAIAAAGAHAKIRTGGVTPDAFPTVEQVAQFVLSCRDAGVAFKATAGLHHPVRADYRLTYEADSAQGTMHGFLNVFLAAAVASAGGQAGELAAVLAANNDGFVFDDAGVRVFERQMTTLDVEKARAFIRSFGSCSFEEPVDDLKGLGLL